MYKKEYQGNNGGFIYKNVEAFDSGKGVCYIPEYSDDEYTRKDLEDLCELNGWSRHDAEALFDEIDWQSPETRIEEWNQQRNEEE